MAANARSAAPSSAGPVRAVAVALFVLTLLFFARALGNGFVNYDDPDYVTANPTVQRGLTAAGVRWALTAQAASNWHPLTWMSHMLDVTLFGRSPAGHHATSVVLHALNAALAFLVLRRLTGALWLSAFAAALFAWHPLRVESVAWVSERKDVLSGAFFFLCLWAYTRYAERRRDGIGGGGWYALTLASFSLGLLAKPMLVTVPCVLLLLDYWPLRRLGVAPRASVGGLLVEKLPLFALAGVSCLVTYVAQKNGGAVTTALPLDERVANAVVSVVRYIGLMLWPSNLAALYPHPGHWRAGLVALSVAGTVALSGIAWWQRRARPWLLVGWLWFLGMLVPVIGLVQVGIQSLADRYTYLPGLGLELALLWTLREFRAGAPRARALAALVLAAAAMLTVAQIGAWQNSLVLFNRTIAFAGEGNYLAYDNRGIAWSEAGQPERALADFRHALALNPTYPNANNNLARALADRGQLEEALAHYRTALAAAPTMLEVHNNFANALSDAGRIDEAIEHYQYVLARRPDHVNALNGYAVALASKGQLGPAEQQFRHVLELDPANASAMGNLGNVCAMLGRRDEAERWFQAALAGHPDDARTLYNLGNVLLEKGQLADAAEKFGRAVQLVPVNPEAHAALGVTLLRLGRRTDAVSHFRTALAQRPGYAQAQAWLDAAEKVPMAR